MLRRLHKDLFELHTHTHVAFLAFLKQEKCFVHGIEGKALSCRLDCSVCTHKATCAKAYYHSGQL